MSHTYFIYKNHPYAPFPRFVELGTVLKLKTKIETNTRLPRYLALSTLDGSRCGLFLANCLEDITEYLKSQDGIELLKMLYPYIKLEKDIIYD